MLECRMINIWCLDKSHRGWPLSHQKLCFQECVSLTTSWASKLVLGKIVVQGILIVIM